MAEKQKRKAELHGKCGAGILYFTNGLLFSIGLTTVIYGTLVKFQAFAKLNTPKFTGVFPDFMIYGLIAFGAAIVVFSGIGLFGTICMRKAADKMYTYEDAHPEDTKTKKHDAPCCATCTLALYIILTMVSFILLLAAGGIAASYQTGVLNEQVDGLKTKYADPILDQWDQAITGYVQANTLATDWVGAMDVGRCCGWQYGNETVVGVNTKADCCKEPPRNSGNETIIEDAKCRANTKVSPAEVYLCDAYIWSLLGDNLVPIMGTLFGLAFICLACFICAIVVRFAIHKEKKRRATTTPETEMEKV